MIETSASAPLSAFLSEQPRFEWRGRAVEIGSRKPRALLCYLALQSEEMPRERLAELLWGPERLLNVRQALYQLRQLPGADSWLRVGDRIGLHVESDVRRFELALQADRYREALEAWSPPLLEGLEGLRAPAFAEWLELERARLEGLYLSALERRAGELERTGEFEAALDLVRRFLDIDPLRESAYRSAMRLSYLLGATDEAMDAYRSCLAVMRTELDSEPLPATVALAKTIEEGGQLSAAVTTGNLPAPLLRILQAHAVGGGELTARQLAAVLDLDEFETAEGLAGLESRRHLSGNGVLSEEAAAATLVGLADPVRVLLHGRVADVLIAEGGEGREESIGEHLLRANRPEEAATWFLKRLERLVSEQDDDQTLLPGFRVLWCGNPEQCLEAALLMESQCERAGEGELQDALLQEAQSVAWGLQQDGSLARVSLRRARRLMRLRQLTGARKLADDALTTARRIGDEVIAAQSVNALGAIAFMEGSLDEAERLFSLNESAEVEEERYRALNNLGAVAGLRGDLTASYRYLEQSLTLVRRLGKVADVGACLNNLAATAERLADYGKAVEKLREGRDLARRTGNRAHTLQTLVNLAQIHLRQGDLGPAWNTGQEALEEAAALGDVRSEAQALEQLGQLARTVGATGESVVLFEQALRRIGDGDERRVAGLQANLLLSSQLADSGSDFSAAAERIEALERIGSNDVASWFWAELALLDRDCGRVQEWSERALQQGANSHLTLVARIASLRSALMSGTDVTENAEALADLLPQLETVEGPLGHLLIAIADEEEDPSPHAELALTMLREQGQGLPRRLRESLMRQPGRWRSALGFHA